MLEQLSRHTHNHCHHQSRYVKCGEAHFQRSALKTAIAQQNAISAPKGSYQLQGKPSLQDHFQTPENESHKLPR